MSMPCDRLCICRGGGHPAVNNFHSESKTFHGLQLLFGRKPEHEQQRLQISTVLDCRDIFYTPNSVLINTTKKKPPRITQNRHYHSPK